MWLWQFNILYNVQPFQLSIFLTSYPSINPSIFLYNQSIFLSFYLLSYIYISLYRSDCAFTIQSCVNLFQIIIYSSISINLFIHLYMYDVHIYLSIHLSVYSKNTFFALNWPKKNFLYIIYSEFTWRIQIF